MPEFKNIFEHEKVGDGLKKPYEELKTPFKKETYKAGPLDKQKGEEEDMLQGKDYYGSIVEELRSQKKGGADIHLSQIKIAELSRGALDLYKLHNQDKLEEKTIRNFLANVQPGSNEYNFGAMLLNWFMDKLEKKKTEEREILKREAEEKMKNDPHVSAKIENIDLSFLRKPEWEVTLGKRSFESYEEKVLEYLRSIKKKGEETEVIKEDPRFQYYCVMQEIMKNKSINPDNFLNNL